MGDRPIDRTKKSNRRCVNCEHYPSEKTECSAVQCRKNARVVNYWNCCYQFEWSTRKKYKEKS